MKKAIVLILSVVMVIAVLSACGSENSEPADATSTRTASNSGEMTSDSSESSVPAESTPAGSEPSDEDTRSDTDDDSAQASSDDVMVTLGNIEITEMPVALSVFENDGWAITAEKDDYGWYYLSKGESNIRCALNAEQNDQIVYLDIHDADIVSDNELYLGDSVPVLIFGTPIMEVTGEFLIERLGEPTRSGESDDSLEYTFGESTLDNNKQSLCAISYWLPNNTFYITLKDWDYYTSLNN